MTFATSFGRRRPLAFLLTLLLFLRDTFSRPSATKRKSAPLKATPPSRMRQRPQRANDKKAPFCSPRQFLKPTPLAGPFSPPRRKQRRRLCWNNASLLCPGRHNGPRVAPTVFAEGKKPNNMCFCFLCVCVRAERRVEGMRLDGRQRPGSARGGGVLLSLSC